MGGRARGIDTLDPYACNMLSILVLCTPDIIATIIQLTLVVIH